jgi:hypothetical protein
VVYIEESENVVADALSHMYSNDSPGTRRSGSEFSYHDVVNDDTSSISPDDRDLPVLTAIEARVATRCGSRVRRLTEKAALGQLDSSKQPALPVKDHFLISSHQKGGSKAKTKKPPSIKPRPEPTGDHTCKSS